MSLYDFWLTIKLQSSNGVFGCKLRIVPVHYMEMSTGAPDGQAA